MQILFYSAILAVVVACITADTCTNCIELDVAGNYVLLAGAAITNNGASVITGNVGLHPGSAITGFGTPCELNGVKDVANSAANNAKNALTTAYNEAKGKDYDALLGANLGVSPANSVLSPGVYKFGDTATVGANGVLELIDTYTDDKGDTITVINPTWTFQIPASLLFSEGSEVKFSGAGGVTADQVTWQVGSSATIMQNANVLGNILAYASITAEAGATVNGRLLAREAAVTLDADTVTKP